MVRGRPRKFDEQEVLEEAALIFRERGYAGTSLHALSEAMGMGEQSIYNAFGTKEQVFRRALEHYCTESGRTLAVLTAPEASGGAIKAFMHHVVDQLVSGAPACLVTRTCLSSEEADAQVAQQLARQIRKIEKHFQKAVERAVELGEAHCKSPKAVARFFTMTIQGLTVMAKCGTSRRALREQVALAMKVLD